jgi:DNA-binding transcriptional LysR family regulator
MNKRLDAAAARIRDSEEEVLGELRVTTTLAFGTLWLAPRLPKLYERYPDLKIDLMLEERVLDLPMREADVAIRMKEPSQADLIRKKLMGIRIAPYASKSYLARSARLESIEDIQNHRVITQGPSSPQVAAGASLAQQLMVHEPQSLLTINNYFGVLQATLNDLGVGVLPDYITEDFPDAGAGAAGRGVGRGAGVPRLPGGAAPVQAGGGVPRLRSGGGHRPSPPDQGGVRRGVSHDRRAWRACPQGTGPFLDAVTHAH